MPRVRVLLINYVNLAFLKILKTLYSKIIVYSHRHNSKLSRVPNHLQYLPGRKRKEIEHYSLVASAAQNEVQIFRGFFHRPSNGALFASFFDIFLFYKYVDFPERIFYTC
jgi:hypothetical protein